MAVKTVAVTGANGFVASYLVKLLLERGYNVRGTVRDPDDSAKVGHLLDMPGAKERLTLYKAHLLEEGAFDNVFTGVEGVFHTASPCPLGPVSDVENDLLIPAIKGATNVLSAAAKAKTVKRVALTSSNAAVSFCEAGLNPKGPNVVVDESWWSDVEWCRRMKYWYMVSKTLAEQAAWDFTKNHDFDLVVLNPTLVLGRMLQNSLNASSEVVLRFLDVSKGWILLSIGCTEESWGTNQFVPGTEKEYPNRMIGVVHPEDVAKAHILAYENPSAQGRYLLAERAMHASEFVDLLRVLSPGCTIPEKCVDKLPQIPTVFCTDKSRSLGLVYTPAEEAIKECIADLKEKNYLKC